MIRAGRPLHTLACCVLLGVPAALHATPCEHEVLIARAHELAPLLESRAAVSSMSGRLVERLAFRDGQVALYDESGRGTYAVEWVAIEPTDLGRQPGASPAEQVLAARLDRHGRSGVCAYDAVFQALPGRPRELLVLLRGEGG
jgi:hypothetical protein